MTEQANQERPIGSSERAEAILAGHEEGCAQRALADAARQSQHASAEYQRVVAAELLDSKYTVCTCAR